MAPRCRECETNLDTYPTKGDLIDADTVLCYYCKVGKQRPDPEEEESEEESSMLSRASITRDHGTRSDLKSTTRNRSWVFTMFNEEDVKRLRTQNNVDAICIGREICPKTNKEHYQGYVRFDQPCRFSWWKNQYPKVHVEPRMGTEHQAAEYCRKDGDVIVDEGCEGPSRKKFKGDQHEQAANMIANGCTKAQVHREMGPRYYYLNARKIDDYHATVCTFRANHEEYI